MRRSAFFLVLFIFAGCATVSKWTDAQKACATDPACLADVKGYAKIGEAVASGFGPIPSAAAGATITFIGLGILGLKKKKKEGA